MVKEPVEEALRAEIRETALMVLETHAAPAVAGVHAIDVPATEHFLINVFFEADDTVAQVIDGTLAGDLSAALLDALPQTFPFLAGWTLQVNFDSMEHVQRIGGWGNYYE